MIEAIIDSAANQTTLASAKSVTQLFYDFGISVDPRVNKDMFSGIQRVKSYLKDANGNTKLYIFKTCTNLIRELKAYHWGNSDLPVKTDDHALDELRYYIMTCPQNIQPKEEPTLIARQKNRLIRRLGRR